MHPLVMVLAPFVVLFAAVALASVVGLVALAVWWLAPRVLSDELVEGR